ncbi:MAG: hypothetical protein OEU54_13860 [Gemmatimonadota bacterium]|nr:hypothetical protein [Gemmatimonadota bacterium]
MMRTAVSHTRLYSYLVTRHTGRAVRTNIEEQLAVFEETVLAVLDLEHVELIDFSCADEVVAKLVTMPGVISGRRFFLFRGIADRHSEPIESALSRQGLAAAGETIDGDPFVMGDIEPEFERAWRALWRVGRAAPTGLAEQLSLTIEVTTELLTGLDSRGLVIRDGDDYVSFGRALADAPASMDGAPVDPATR